MKKNLLALIIIGITFSCSKDNENAASVSWRLIEQLQDPGGGMGEFEPVESDKTLRFLDNSVMVSGGLCNMSPEGGENVIYSITGDSILVSGCDWIIRYEQHMDELILHFPCIEACQQKYSKVTE